MKELIIIIFSFFLFLIPEYSYARVKKTITLEQLVQITLKRSPALELARLKLAKYEAMLNSTKLLYLPRLQISSKAAPTPTYRCVVPEEWMNLVELNGMSEKEFQEKYCVGTNRDDSITTELDGYFLRFRTQAIMPLYTFGKISYARAMAKQAVNAGEYGVKQVNNHIKFLVYKSYYSRKAVFELKKLMKEADKEILKAKNKAESLEMEGKITPAEYLRLKLGFNQINIQQLEIDRMDKLTLSALRILTGNDKMDISSKHVPLKKTKKVPSLDALLKITLNNNPQFKMKKKARAVANANIGLAKAAFYPDLAVFARYTLTLSNSDDPKSAFAKDGLHSNSLAFGIGLDWKIDFYKLVSSLRSARNQKRQIEAEIAVFKDKIRMELGQARQDIVYNQKKLDLTLRGIKLARAWAVTTNENNKNGKYKPKEIIDSLAAYFKNKIAFYEVKYALFIAWK
ncbi:MAG: TolC family protein [Deltaproteobacteria bacterium]|jgi:outer membrane protein TolC|nr:TolC family protein [Deltaproteobacteria bacterium]